MMPSHALRWWARRGRGIEVHERVEDVELKGGKAVRDF